MCFQVDRGSTFAELKQTDLDAEIQKVMIWFECSIYWRRVNPGNGCPGWESVGEGLFKMGFVILFP